MAVPSKGEFEEVLELFDSFDSSEMLMEDETILRFTDGSRLDKVQPSYDDVYPIISQHQKVITKKNAEINRSACMKWLVDQNCFHRAYKSAFGELAEPDLTTDITELATLSLLKRHEVISKDEYIKSLSSFSHVKIQDYTDDEIADMFESQNDEVRRLNRFHNALHRKLRYKFGEWHKGLFNSLYTYHYEDMEESDLKIHNSQKNAANITLESSEALLGLLNDDTRNTNNHPLSDTGKLIRVLTRLNLELEDFIAATDIRPKPIKKLGETARERLLVLNLWKEFKKWPRSDGRGSTRATAINHLLSLEGINSPLEQRTIERLIKGWIDEEKLFKATLRDKRDEMIERRTLKRRHRILF